MRNWIIVVCAILAISVFQFAGTVTATDDNTPNVTIIAASDEDVEVETDEGVVEEEGDMEEGDMEEGTDEEVPAEDGDAE